MNGMEERRISCVCVWFFLLFSFFFIDLNYGLKAGEAGIMIPTC